VILNVTAWLNLGLSDPSTRLYFSTATSAVAAVAQVAVPLALGAAIFREGLLDIDLVLNRTITYGALTAILVGGFVLLSSLIQRILVATTGQSSDIALLIAAVPLALAFLPLRSALLRFAARFISGKRVLTILFVDIAGSTELAVRIGDRAWGETLERFRAVVRPELKRCGGEEIDTAGDGFFVTFDGPDRALRCARAIVDATRRIGIDVRAGLHVGEVEVYAEGVSGVAVHYASRLMALARPGEVLVSQPLRELVAGSDIVLPDRGEHELKGIPGTARVFAVESE
jgi:class 3 adenylate cyclase